MELLTIILLVSNAGICDVIGSAVNKSVSITALEVTLSLAGMSIVSTGT